MSNAERQAFFEVCAEAQPATGHFVSLYRIEQFYGGPEEGGWWGHDYILVAYQRTNTQEHADYLSEQITKLADELSSQARSEFNRGCAAELEWLEARGLDESVLPEVGGPDRYAVFIEDVAGEMASTGDRSYS